MACCVPGCINRLHKWAIEFPRDKQLRARWKASIRAGTGQSLTDEVEQSAPVCNLHFTEQDSQHGLDAYREPFLFKRKSVQFEVACCRLCLRYDSIDNMLDMDDCSVPGSSLNWLASKYSWLFQLDNGRRGYFCNSCNVQVEMTDEFGQKIRDAATEYKKLLQKMANERMIFKRIKKEIPEAKASVRAQASMDRRKTPESVGFPMCVIVKQEPFFSESETNQQVEATQVFKQEPIIADSGSSRRKVVREAEVEQTNLKVETQPASPVPPETGSLKITNVTGASKHLDSDTEEQEDTIPQKKKRSKKKPTPTTTALATRTGGKGRKYPMCLLCQKTFLHSKEIVIHFKQVHPDTELKTFDCKDCDEVFFLSTSYHSHRKYHTNKFACDRCGKKHISMRGLVRHLYISHEVPFSEEHLLPCPICEKKVRDYNFTSHIRYHTKLGQTADNFEQKIGDVEKQYKKLLEKRLKEGVNIGSSSVPAVGENNDSENGEQVQKDERMEDEEATDESLNNESGKETQDPSKVLQNVNIKEEPDVVESETSMLEEEPEVDIPEDLIVKEEPQLTEPHQPSNDDTQKNPKSSNSNKSSSLKCYICSTTLETKVSLYNHLMNDHEAQESYRCEECKTVFTQIVTFNNHLAKHGMDRRFKCSYCALRFHVLQKQLQHESKKHGIDHEDKSPTKPKCEICGQAFSNKDNLKRHVRVKHKGDVRPKAPPLASRGGTGRSVPTCNVCQATFQHSKEVVTHFQQVHPEKDFKSYPCTKCDEVFFLATTIVTHRYIHTDKFACDRCRKRHTSKQDLVRHLHVVHKVPYSEDRYRECQVCHQQIRDYNFSAHQRVHRNDGPLPCEHCGKSYKSSFSLNNHSKRCQSERPLASRTGGKSRTQPKCEVCQAVFEHVNEVEPHFKQVHPEKELKTYPCTICGDILFSYFMLFRHRYIHSEKFACDLCDETLQSKDDLARHRRSVHSVKPDKEFFTTCEICDHRFSRPDYRRHIKSEKHKLNLARSQALKKQE